MRKILSIAFFAVAQLSMAQTDTSVNLDDLLGDTGSDIEYANNAFKSTRVIMGHSMEMIGKGVLDTRILHRFGTVQNGVKDLFGLDNATMRMGFDYGVTKNLTVGIGRSTHLKELDGFVKYRVVQQSKGKKNMPMSVIYVAGMTGKTIALPSNEFTNHLGYYHQLIIGRKFSNAFSAQLSPTFIHQNYILLPLTKNDMMALGIGARYKVTERVAFLLDTYPAISGAASGYNQVPVSIGMDIETGGHVFQLHFSNATGMNERAFSTETAQRWDKKQFQFGFNLSRVFTVVRNQADNQ